MDTTRNKKTSNGLKREKQGDQVIISKNQNVNKTKSNRATKETNMDSIIHRIDQHFTTKAKKISFNDIILQKRDLLRLQLSIDVTTKEIDRIGKTILDKESDIFQLEREYQIRKSEYESKLEQSLIETEEILMLVEDMEARTRYGKR